MDKAVTSDQAYECIKAFVELGGTHYIDKDSIIHSSIDDAPAGVEVGNPPRRKPIAIFKMGMKVGEYVPLNPFTDVLTRSPEREWFTNKLMAFPGSIVFHIVQRMIEEGISEKDSGIKVAKLISKWVDKMDSKLLEEAARIRPKHWCRIFYDRTTFTAQLQSDIGTDDLKDEYKSRIRKSSWPVFTEMVKAILGLAANKKPESLMYTATIKAIPKVDAIMHLLVEFCERIDDHRKILTEVEIDLENIKFHVKHLELYREATRWFATASATPDAAKASVSELAPAWQSAGSTASAVQMTAEPADARSAVSKLVPTGVVVNPNFGTYRQMSPLANPGGYPAIPGTPPVMGMPAGNYGGFQAPVPDMMTASSIANLRM